jgi:hypothetical protein
VFKLDVVDTTGAGDAFTAGFVYKVSSPELGDWGVACEAESAPQQPHEPVLAAVSVGLLRSSVQPAALVLGFVCEVHAAGGWTCQGCYVTLTLNFLLQCTHVRLTLVLESLPGLTSVPGSDVGAHVYLTFISTCVLPCGTSAGQCTHVCLTLMLRHFLCTALCSCWRLVAWTACWQTRAHSRRRSCLQQPQVSHTHTAGSSVQAAWVKPFAHVEFLCTSLSGQLLPLHHSLGDTPALQHHIPCCWLVWKASRSSPPLTDLPQC